MHLLYVRLLTILLAPLAMWAVIYGFANVTHVSLKPLKPWLTAICWIFWGLYAIVDITKRPSRDVIFAIYTGATLVLAWIQRRYLFKSDTKPSRSLASILKVPEPTYIAVKNVSATAPWYIEKFGLRELAPSDEARPDGVTLQFKADSSPIILVPKDPAIHRPLPVFFTRNVEKARERLMAEGISVGQIQQDYQGARHFELLDNEGNRLEVCCMP